MLEGEFCCVLAFGWSRRDLFICQAGKLYCPCRCAGSIKWIHEPWPKKLRVRVSRVVASLEFGQLGHRTHLSLLRRECLQAWLRSKDGKTAAASAARGLFPWIPSSPKACELRGHSFDFVPVPQTAPGSFIFRDPLKKP